MESLNVTTETEIFPRTGRLVMLSVATPLVFIHVPAAKKCYFTTFTFSTDLSIYLARCKVVLVGKRGLDVTLD